MKVDSFSLREILRNCESFCSTFLSWHVSDFQWRSQMTPHMQDHTANTPPPAAAAAAAAPPLLLLLLLQEVLPYKWSHLKSLFPLRCNNGLRSGFIQHVHSPVFHFISPGTKLLFLSTLWQTRCVTQTDCERAFVCLTACVLKRQAGLMGFSCKPPTGNSLLYTFPSPACSADTPPSWLACLWARRDPKGLPCF